MGKKGIQQFSKVFSSLMNSKCCNHIALHGFSSVNDNEKKRDRRAFYRFHKTFASV